MEETKGPGSGIFAATESSSMQDSVFVEYLKDFHNLLEERGLLDGKPHVLVLDGHASHVNFDVIKLMTKVFTRFPMEHGERTPLISNLVGIIGEAFRSSFSKEQNIASFAAAGFRPQQEYTVTGVRVSTVILGGVVKTRRYNKKRAISQSSGGVPCGGLLICNAVLAAYEEDDSRNKKAEAEKAEKARLSMMRRAESEANLARRGRRGRGRFWGRTWKLSGGAEMVVAVGGGCAGIMEAVGGRGDGRGRGRGGVGRVEAVEGRGDGRGRGVVLGPGPATRQMNFAMSRAGRQPTPRQIVDE
eukprot:jgi/Undpi1/12971/HiC_scaffold_7.g02637.m1